MKVEINIPWTHTRKFRTTAKIVHGYSPAKKGLFSINGPFIESGDEIEAQPGTKLVSVTKGGRSKADYSLYELQKDESWKRIINSPDFRDIVKAL